MKFSNKIIIAGTCALSLMSASVLAQDNASRNTPQISQDNSSELGGAVSPVLLALIAAILAGLVLAASGGGGGEDAPASPQ